MRILLSLFLILLSTILIAQDEPCKRKVSGIIRDIDSGEILPFATVRIQESDKGVISDKNGEFVITQICKEEIHLEVRFVGYKTVVHHHDFHHSDPIIYMAPDETLLESIIVEESRSDQLQTISTKRKEISMLEVMNSSIGDLSEELTGVSLLKTGANISKPIIHGLHSNRVLVINDGVRHAYQVWGDEHAPEIDPSHVDQIEIVKGAGTVKYGPDALGGVILYNSKKPAFDQELTGSIGTSYQTNGKAISSQLNLEHGTHRFAWNIGAFGIYQGDLNSPDYNLSNTGKREAGLSFNTLLHRPKFDLQISGNYFDQELGILRASVVGNLEDLQNGINSDSIPRPTFPFTYDIQSPRQDTEHGLLKSELSLFLGKHVFNFQYAFQANLRKEFDVRRGELNDRPVIDLKLLSHTFDTEWTQPMKDRWSGYSGVQLFTQKSINTPGSNPSNFVPDYDVLNIGAFTIQSYKYDKSTLELGVRFDLQSLSVADTIRVVNTYANSIDFSSLTGTLGFRRQLSKDLSGFSNIGYAWRPPNVAELYSFGLHHSRLQYGLWRYELNPEIVTPIDRVFDESDRQVYSEKGIKWVSGLEIAKPKLTAEFIFYLNKINNYIFLRPFGVTIGPKGTLAFFVFEQTDAVFLGSDWDIRYEHTDLFSSEIKLSFVYAKSTAKQQPLLEIPPLNINYALNYKKDSWNFGLDFNYTAKQWNAPPVIDPIKIHNQEIEIDPSNDIFDFMAPPQAYFLIGGKVAYETKIWNAEVKIDNMLNSSYRIYTDRLRYYADAPGRNISLALQFLF